MHNLIFIPFFCEEKHSALVAVFFFPLKTYPGDYSCIISERSFSFFVFSATCSSLSGHTVVIQAVSYS